MSANLLDAPLEGDAIEALLPHRPPLMLIDRVSAAYGPPRSEVRASYRVRADHPILAGHFPGRPIWPGALTIEGLAQTANVLGVLLARSSSPQGGESPAPDEHRGLLAAVEVKLLQIVVPGDRLDYAARLVGELERVHRLEVSATVGRRLVARGSIAVALTRSA